MVQMYFEKCDSYLSIGYRFVLFAKQQTEYFSLNEQHFIGKSSQTANSQSINNNQNHSNLYRLSMELISVTKIK